MSSKSIPTKSFLFARDVQDVAGVSRTKAIDYIHKLGGEKDSAGRWRVDARRFLTWYNNPCSSMNAEGGENMMQLDNVVSEIQKYAAGEQVTFGLVRPKGKKNYYIRVYRGRKSKLIGLRTPEKKLAKAIEAEILTRFSRAVIEGIVARKTSEFFDEWLAVKEREIKLSTYKKYRSVIDKAMPVLPREVHRVKRQHIEQYKQLLIRDGYAPKTIHEELCVLHAVFENARLLGYTGVNPLDGVPRPSKQPREPVEPYTEAELEAVFAELRRQAQGMNRNVSAAAWNTYLELFHCLNFTGMRVSDAVKLRWGDVSLPFGALCFTQTKTSKEATVRIPSLYIERLKNLAPSTTPRPDDLVYPSTTGEAVSYNSLDKAIRKVLKACGFRKKSPIHAFRHTVAMRLLGSGMPVHEVANQLGDSVETIVRTYIKPKPPSRDDVDTAYSPGSRKGHSNMEEMEGLAAIGGTRESPPNDQIFPQQKGFLAVSKNPQVP